MSSTSDPFTPVAKSALAIQGTEPNPADIYYCPNYFELELELELEREAIFKRP